MSKVIISDTEKKLRMGWSAPPAAPKCPCCKVSVYPAEAVMASDRLNMMLNAGADHEFEYDEKRD